MIAPDSLAGVHVFFPDPWPKKRHHKRRLLQPAFVHALAARLAPGGYFHAATDWEDYAHEMLVAFAAEPLLRNTAQGFAPRPATRPLTKFEARGQQARPRRLRSAIPQSVKTVGRLKSAEPVIHRSFRRRCARTQRPLARKR